MPVRDERGSAFVVCIFLLLVLALLGLGILAAATTDLKISDNYARSVRNMYVADAAANYAVAMLQEDPLAGSHTPYPTGTPYKTGALGQHTWSIWLWNRRVNGNGTTTDFADTRSRQFVVEARDNRRGVRRLMGVIDPSRSYPKALDYGMFACESITLAGGELEGSMYSGGNITFNTNDSSPTGTTTVEARGDITFTKKAKGSAKANGNIVLNDDVEKTCHAGGTITGSKNCKTGKYPGTTPLPVKEYCNVANAADWDPGMLNMNTGKLAQIFGQTPLANQYVTGLTRNTDMTLDGNYYVKNGNATFSSPMKLTYNNQSVLVVDDGFDFDCNGCEFKKGDPGNATLTIITSNGNILLRNGAKGTNQRVILWAGVVDASGNLPAKGSIIDTSANDFETKGEMVALRAIQSDGKFEALIDNGKPPVFGDVNAYAITEWREVR